MGLIKPHPAGLPHIEQLEFVNTFADNDWVYRCFVSPFGPLPGADDLHALTFFDLLDEPEGALLSYAESPKEGEAYHRGWPIPPVKGWRRKRNYVLGATFLIRPSDKKPLELEPPSAKPGRCASPGCPFFVHPALSSGGGKYCCHKCHEKPNKHAAGCQRCEVAGVPPGGGPEWALATHGTVDVEVTIQIKLPIPTWLIPLSFLRWVLIKVIKLFYPYLIALNERFTSTPFAERVRDDADGFYARLRSTLTAPHRPWRATSGGPDFVI